MTERIDWSLSAEEIARQLAATGPPPPGTPLPGEDPLTTLRKVGVVPERQVEPPPTPIEDTTVSEGLPPLQPGAIDWTNPAEDVARKVAATGPAPPGTPLPGEDVRETLRKTGVIPDVPDSTLDQPPLQPVSEAPFLPPDLATVRGRPEPEIVEPLPVEADTTAPDGIRRTGPTPTVTGTARLAIQTFARSLVGAVAELPGLPFSLLRGAEERVDPAERRIDLRNYADSLKQAELEEGLAPEVKSMIQGHRIEVERVIADGTIMLSPLELGFDPEDLSEDGSLAQLAASMTDDPLARDIEEQFGEAAFAPEITQAIAQIPAHAIEFVAAHKIVGINNVKAVGSSIKTALNAGKAAKQAARAGQIAKVGSKAVSMGVAAAVTGAINKDDPIQSGAFGAVLGSALSAVDPAAARFGLRLIERGASPRVTEAIIKSVVDAGVFGGVTAAQQVITDEEIDGLEIGSNAAVGAIFGLLASKNFIRREIAMERAIAFASELGASRGVTRAAFVNAEARAGARKAEPEPTVEPTVEPTKPTAVEPVEPRPTTGREIVVEPATAPPKPVAPPVEPTPQPPAEEIARVEPEPPVEAVEPPVEVPAVEPGPPPEVPGITPEAGVSAVSEEAGPPPETPTRQEVPDGVQREEEKREQEALAAEVPPPEVVPPAEEPVGEEPVVKPTEAPEPLAVPEAEPAVEAVQAPEVAATRPVGEVSEATTERGMEVATRFRLVDESDLTSSHRNDLTVNPDFPQRFQPRGREAAASEAQITKIETRLRPTFLGDSPQAGQGAPIIGPDFLIESGNARTIALRRGYEQGSEQIENYRTWLKKNALQFGLTPEQVDAIERPILVRERTTDLSTADREEFVRQANEADIADLSAPDQAKVDAERLGAPVMALLSPGAAGDINVASNRPFIRAFAGEVIPTSQLAEFMDDQGVLSQAGETRVRNAIAAKAFPETDILKQITEATDDDTKTVTKSLVATAPAFAHIRDGIAAGVIPDVPAVAPIVAATQKYGDLKQEGTPIPTALKQESLFEPDARELGDRTLAMYNDNSRSARRITEILREYSNEVILFPDPAQGSLEGFDPQSEAEVGAAFDKASLKVYARDFANNPKAQEKHDGDLASYLEDVAKTWMSVANPELDAIAGAAAAQNSAIEKPDDLPDAAPRYPYWSADAPGMPRSLFARSNKGTEESVLTNATMNELGNMLADWVPARPGFEDVRVSPKDMRQASAAILKALGLDPIIRKGNTKRGTVGHYDLVDQVMRLRDISRPDWFLHEVAHGAWMVLSPDINASLDETTGARAAVQKLAEDLYGPDAPIQEGIANLFVRNLLFDDAPPVAVEWWNDFVKQYPSVSDAYDSAKDTFFAFKAQGGRNRMLSAIEEEKTGLQKVIEDVKKVDIRKAADEFKTHWVDVDHVFSKIDHQLEIVLDRPLQIDESLHAYNRSMRGFNPVVLFIEKMVTDENGIPLTTDDGRPLSQILHQAKKNFEDFSAYSAVSTMLPRAIEAEKRAAEDRTEPRDQGLAMTARELLQIQKGFEADFPEFRGILDQTQRWERAVRQWVRKKAPSMAPLMDALDDAGTYVTLTKAIDEATLSPAAKRAGNTLKRLSKKGGFAGFQEPWVHTGLTFVQMGSMAIRQGSFDRLVYAYKDAHASRRSDLITKYIRPVERDLEAQTFSAGEIERALKSAGVEGLALTDAEKMQIVTMWSMKRDPRADELILPWFNPETEKVEWYELDETVYSAFQNYDPVHLGISEKTAFGIPNAINFLLKKSTRAVKAGAVSWNASFGLLTNTLKDPKTAVVQTNNNPWRLLFNVMKAIPVVANPFRAGTNFDTWMKAINDQDPRLQTSILYLTTGAEFSELLFQDTVAGKKVIDDMFRSPIERTFGHPVRLFRSMIGWPEGIWRVSEQLSTLQREGFPPGWSREEIENLRTNEQFIRAIQQSARDARLITGEFPAKGSYTKMADEYMPFFGANITGTREAVARLSSETYSTDKGHKWDSSKAKKAASAAMVLFAGGLLNWMRNKDEDWYNELTDFERAMYEFVPITDRVVLKLPIGYEWANIFQGLFVSMVHGLYKQDPELVMDALGETMRSFNPISIPPVVNVASEWMLNRRSFAGTPIVAPHLVEGPSKVQPGLWRNAYTSLFANELGDLFPETLAPAKIDQAINSLTGGLGPNLARGGETLSEWLGLTSEGEREIEPSDFPIIGRIMRRGGITGTNSRSMNELFEELDYWQRRSNNGDRRLTAEQRDYLWGPEDAQGERSGGLAGAASAIITLRQALRQPGEDGKPRGYTLEQRQATMRIVWDVAREAIEVKPDREEFLDPETAQAQAEGLREDIGDAVRFRRRFQIADRDEGVTVEQVKASPEYQQWSAITSLADVEVEQANVEILHELLNATRGAYTKERLRLEMLAAPDNLLDQDKIVARTGFYTGNPRQQLNQFKRELYGGLGAYNRARQSFQAAEARELPDETRDTIFQLAYDVSDGRMSEQDAKIAYRSLQRDVRRSGVENAREQSGNIKVVFDRFLSSLRAKRLGATANGG